MTGRLTEYLHKSHIQRQIMSNRARRYRRLSTAQNSALVAISGLATFIGFSGTEAISNYLQFSFESATEGDAKLLFNLVVFFLFLLGILHLVFNFGGRQIEASQAVARLAAFANEIEDRISSLGKMSETPEDVEKARVRYTSIMDSIPENSDREFLQAKKDFLEKETKKDVKRFDASPLFLGDEQERIVADAIHQSKRVMSILRTLRDNGSQLYAGGGLIRNLIWDAMHRHTTETPADDVDVIHFDTATATREHDDAIERRLREISPNVVWSVKNQARMHIHNSEPEYDSLDDAISKWPETCTAIVCKLDFADRLQFVAPFGFDDLVRLIVTPTPTFMEREQVIVDRVTKKNWLSQWPKLRLALSRSSLEDIERRSVEVDLDECEGSHSTQPPSRHEEDDLGNAKE